ncbi:MAG: acyl-CoA dehydrogenase C-terminal domain-containing protein, partial [Erythrobacter sp.]
AQDCAGIARWMRDEASLDDRLAGSVPFTTMSAVAVAGWQMLRQARAVADGAAPSLAHTKPVTTRFFLDRIVPEANGLKAGAIAGADLLYEVPVEKLAV